MPFEPKKITELHIRTAVEKIERNSIKLEPSTIYDVEVSGKKYPPKEIMRYAHEEMNGERIWYLGGGEETNKYLRKFQFPISTKATIWKLGCNWERGNPSFYKFIRQEKIVIGTNDPNYKYKVGDLVVVTEGFTVLAITKVVNPPVACRTNKLYKTPFNRLKIPYESLINYSDAFWYELPPSDRFEYKLVQGIRKINKEGIRDKIVKLWESRNKSNDYLGNINYMDSKNTILYGPPGTGKTYHSIDRAVHIAAGHVAPTHQENKQLFDKFRDDGQIEFVTFHQNYSYEDFMVGIKPDVENSVLSFDDHHGIFYTLCKEAERNYISATSESIQHQVEDFDAVFSTLVKPIVEDDEPVQLTLEKGKKFELLSLTSKSIPFRKQSGDLQHSLSKETVKQLYYGTRDYPSGLSSYYKAVIKELRRLSKNGKKERLKNYVLVIDEINRANISKVFGELITLLEEDKRIGGENELRVTLPNGEKKFGIPPNLYLIGTMNTADKSIALVDVALRRRFEFIGYYPKYEGFDPNAAKLLKAINGAILDNKKSVDYLIGHAYFMKGLPIDSIIKNKIIPLLLEYFSNKIEIVSSIFDNTDYKVKYDVDTYAWTVG